MNPNKSLNYGGIKNHELKLQRKVKIKDAELDLSYGELEDYRKSHTKCEICGKDVDSVNLPTSKIKYHGLCIDHDHATNKFRGLLCITCNRNLGWYENNEK